MILTTKQKAVLKTIVRGNPDGTFCDLDQVISNVNYDTNKQSIQFIIRNLISKGLIFKYDTEKRRTRRRILLCATQQGYDYVSNENKLRLKTLSGAFIDV